MTTVELEKQIRLLEILDEMGGSICNSAGASAYIILLASIYDDVEYRHSYSAITGKLLTQYKEDDQYIETVVLNLGNIIEIIERSVQSYPAGLIKGVKKLYDHVSLEQIRADLTLGETTLRIERAEMQAADARQTYTDAKELCETTIEDAVKLKTEVVSILSIFAAIVLAFMGGMSFTASTFEGIAETSFYRVCIIALICGFVVFNTVAVLLYIVSKIIDRPIYAQCRTTNCSCETQCDAVTRIKNRLPFIYWVNSIIMWATIIVVAGWIIDAYSLAEWVQIIMPWCK